jgi:UDP-N-acetylglucosamine 4-epimerase
MTVARYEQLRDELRRSPRTWAVTGAAGFIGSALVEELLALGQEVVGLDNFSTGHRSNLEDVAARCDGGSFRFVEGDIRRPEDCAEAFRGADVVLHQAALGSVPRSIENPAATHDHNVNGFLNVLVAVRDARVPRLVFASSSSVYGDHPALPKEEDRVGRPLSPYAASKVANELYAGVFGRVYGVQTVGLRYFNVFGRRQSPEGPYAAVIPRWVRAILSGEPCIINGDGETSRDFCYVDNVVQANLLAATTANPAAVDAVFNVACGERTTLNELFGAIRDGLAEEQRSLAGAEPVYTEFRKGDVRHSLASIDRARTLLEYAPTHRLREGLQAALAWYVADARRAAPAVGAA